MDNIKGQTAAFATLSPFRNGWCRELERFVLACAPARTKAVRALEFLHTAQFCRITPKQLRRAGIPVSKELESGALLFMSAYNGDGHVYFETFSSKLHATLNSIWSLCTDWKSAKEYRNLDRFIQTYRRASNCFVSTYPDSSKRIRASLVLRRDIDGLCALAFSDASDATFAAEFEKLALRHWGNG